MTLKAIPKAEATTGRIFQDIDGEHEIYEQQFSDGTSVLMFMSQYNAILVAGARNATNVLAVLDDGAVTE